MQSPILSNAHNGRSPSPPTSHFSLDNGLRVILHEDHRAPLVTAQLWYHVGASHEPVGQGGLSHTLEHLVFAGSSKLGDDGYSKVLARLGAVSRAFTLDDATLYVATLLANRLEIVLEALADIMTHARLDEAAFIRERETVRNERRLRVDSSPDELAKERHLLLAHGASPYARSPYDHLEDLQTMTLDRVRTWYARHYQPNNATLVVAGDIDLSTLRGLVERHFAAISRTPVDIPPGFRQPVEPGERIQTVSLPGLRHGVILSFNTPSLGTAATVTEVHALRVTLALLTTGGSSRLYAALVRDRPILRGVLSEFDLHRRGDTLLTLHALMSTARTRAQDAAEEVLAIVHALGHTLVPSDELERAKTKLLAQQLFQRDALQEQAYSIGRYAISGAPLADMERERDVLQSITAQDIQHVVTRYLNRERLTVTYTQPEGTPQ